MNKLTHSALIRDHAALVSLRRRLERADNRASRLLIAASISARAKRLLHSARRALAAERHGTRRPVLYEAEWGEARRALKTHRDTLAAVAGVVGFGVGYPARGGHREYGTHAVLVFTRRKYSEKSLRKLGIRAIPRHLRRPGGPPVPTDVVAVGSLHRQLLGGASIGRSSPPYTKGTLGTFAIDLDTEALVALTAMHVVDTPDVPPAAPSTMLAPSHMDANSQLLGNVIVGTRMGVDAAKISVVAPATGQLAIEQLGPVRGWRPISQPGDHNAVVQMFGAETDTPVYGRLVEPAVELPAFGLTEAIFASIASQAGDSGAALLDVDGFVLGLLVGEMTGPGAYRVFCPFASIAARLRCDIPSS